MSDIGSDYTDYNDELLVGSEEEYEIRSEEIHKKKGEEVRKEEGEEIREEEGEEIREEEEEEIREEEEEEIREEEGEEVREEEGEEVHEEEGEEVREEQLHEDNNTTTKRSWVWEHFTFDKVVNKARCNYCRVLISCNKGSTSGMSGHAKTKHKLVKDDANNERSQRQLTLQESFSNASEIASYSADVFRQFLVRYIVNGDHSFLSIESKDFHNMIHHLRKDAFIPSADTIKSDIIKTYNSSFKKICQILQKVSGKISFTIDAWTSSNSIPFLGITAHWISNEWELKSLLLDFVKLEGPHSGKNLKVVFLKSLKNFGITDKILGVTTDNASNNISFLNEVSTELAFKNIEFDNNDQHVRCLAHVINLAAQQALKTLKATTNTNNEDEFLNNNNSHNEQDVGEVGGLLHKLRTLICKIRASPQQREKFNAQCKIVDIYNKMVILDVKTRWNSTYDMLVRAREVKEPLNTLSNSDSNLRKFTINEEEWDRLAEIEELLKSFSKATKQICAETYPTLSYAIPLYNLLIDKLENFRDTKGRFGEGKKAAENAINKLFEYYSKTDTSVYTIALVLDPRLKLQYMRDHKWEKYWIEQAKKKTTEIYNKEYKSDNHEQINTEYDLSDDDLLSHISKRQRVTSSELERFLKTARAPALSNTLNWWKIHKEEFPNLANMAKDYLGIPATSAPSERIFSSAADVITPDRARLAPETVRAIMCLKHWYRSGILEN